VRLPIVINPVRSQHPPEAKKIFPVSAEVWEKTFAVNIRGVFFCYKHAAREMIAQDRGGRIIGASSMAGIKGSSLFINAYTASKFAVRGLTQSAAAELGQYGITVNAYAPGMINTPMGKPFLEAGIDMILNNFGYSRPWANFHAGEPEDVANVVSYLASKEAHYVTGQTIAINGGLQY
jgi:NAD(P)-dependent dehydrogenase (short-subunit alcohol dehydrogenase family)